MNDSFSSFDSVESALADIAAGKMVIVTDDEDRENEGDLVIAAEKVTPAAVNMMATHGRGLICAPMDGVLLDRLGISQMVPKNRESQRTAFTVSVDAARGITTGISAYDRAQTLRILADPRSRGEDLVQPGHIFPLHARAGGVLERAGHTEAAVDLARMAGLSPAGVICEILNEDGTMARLPQLELFKKRFGLKLICIAQLIEYRRRTEKLVETCGQWEIKTRYGTFTARQYRSILDNSRHYALTMGALSRSPVLVRVHGETLLADLFGAEGFSNPAGSIERALRRIAAEGAGAFVYVGQPDGGVFQDNGASSSSIKERDILRTYGIGAQILRELGLKQLRLLSNHPRRIAAIEGWGIEVSSTETF